MRLFMTKSSNRSKSTFSPEIREQVKDIISRAMKFKAEAAIILLKYKPPRVREEAKQIIEGLFSKFHSVVRQIKTRHNKRPTLDVNDEYDVQDLLHALLTPYFDDIRREEYTPSTGGTSPRMDILLKREQIVIEAKMTRKGLGKRKFENNLLSIRNIIKNIQIVKLYTVLFMTLRKEFQIREVLKAI